MNDQTKEHISSLMDGEISRETSRFLVRRLGSDEELCETWARYHLVRDCLRHQEGTFSADDLCSRVSRALEDEPQISVRRFSVGWLKPAAGLAIAASVALMAVLSVDPGSSVTQPLPGGVADAQPLESFTSPRGIAPGTVTQQASLSGNSKMNSYLLRHYQATGSSGGKGFVALVPVMIEHAEPSAPDSDDGQTENESIRDEQQQAQ